MIGGFGLHPILVTVASGVVDARLVADAFTSRLIVNGEGGVDDEIEQILSEKQPGSLLVIQGIAGQVLTIKNLAKGGGDEDVRTPGGIDFTVNGEENVTLIYDAVNNEWAFMDGSLVPAGVGANRNLSNLLSPTAINTNLLPDVNITQDLGSALLSWASLWVSAIRFDDDAGAPTSGSPHKISTNTLASIPVMDFNVKAAISRFDFYHIGVVGMSISKDAAGNIIIDPDTVSVGLDIQLQPVATNPAINGVIRHITGGDVKVFSGGALRNFSDIASGANKTLSNLTTPTSINADLIPDGNNTRDLGSALNSWAILWAANFNMDDFGAVPSASSESGMSLSNIASIETVNFNVKSAGTLASRFDFYHLGVVGCIISKDVAGTIIVDADDFNAGLQLTLQPVATDPAINGIMRHITGGDVKIRTGFITKNFTQMPQLDTSNIFTQSMTVTELNMGNDDARQHTMKGHMVINSKTAPSLPLTADDVIFFLDDATKELSIAKDIGVVSLEAGNVPFDDDLILIQDEIDNTKTFQFNLSLVSASAAILISFASGAGRTYTFPNIAGEIAMLAGTQTFSGLKTFTANVVFDEDVTLGSGIGDLIRINGVIPTNLIPSGARDLGAPTTAWNKVYCGDATTSRLRIPVGSDLFDT